MNFSTKHVSLVCLVVFVGLMEQSVQAAGVSNQHMSMADSVSSYERGVGVLTAGRMARLLVKKRQIGGASEAANPDVAELMGKTLYQRFGLTVDQWQPEHLRWYLNHHVRKQRLHARHQAWATVQEIVKALGEDAWLSELRGPWAKQSS